MKLTQDEVNLLAAELDDKNETELDELTIGRVHALHNAYSDMALWNKRILVEQTSMKNRIQTKSDDLQTYHSAYLRKHQKYIDGILARAKIVGAASSDKRDEEEEIFKEILTVFRQHICYKTHVVLDPNKDTVVGLTESYKKVPSVTVGKFGFGTRYNQNSRRIEASREARFILLNADVICRNLRKKKLIAQADMIQSLVDAVPNINNMGGRGIVVPLDAELIVVGRYGSPANVTAIQFNPSYEPIELLSTNAGSVNANPNSRMTSFMAYFAVRKEIVIALKKAEELMRDGGRLSLEEVKNKVQDILGKWLLLGKL